ncbi:hypothetical protein [Paratissierella segnis]|jgi:arginyl-tRNA synthetase|uniref:HeH/LEM domain-containing protein n=1 Tax=Paratissierella segnis TaxID=2763679 RepID=A0A926IM62_9FIRM|nr:hypothetical protein [Paratissierella segnis]MBC8589333.1 hypothetical protein [Paratissierella segnis]
MRYKNTKTGAIIDSPCRISGGDWIEVKEKINETQAEEVNEVEEVEEIEEIKEAEEDPEKEEDFDGITVKEIKQELDAFGIEYNPKARKQELYDLMMQGR